MKKKKKEENPAEQEPKGSKVNVHDDEQMVKLGIRNPVCEPRDPSVWTKTSQEKKVLKRYRKRNFGNMSMHSYPHKSIPVIAKLIVYLKKNNIFPYTTYSHECFMDRIGLILSQYTHIGKKSGVAQNLVSKYAYNGKTYRPEETPFWF